MRKGLLNISIMIFLSTLCFCLFNAFTHAEIVDGIAAVVNEQIITRSEVEKRLQPYLFYAGGKFHANEKQKEIAKIKKGILEDLIKEKLLLIEAQNIGITIKEKEIDFEENKLKEKLGTQEHFEKLLAEQNVTEEEFRESLKKQLLLKKLIDTELRGKIEIPSEDEAVQFYKNNMKNFVEPGKFAISEITVKANDKKDRLEIKKTIDRIHKLLLEGEDFAAMAKKYSCSPSANSGGRLGFVSKGELLPEFADAISALKVGQISGVIKTESGFHIIKLESIKNPHQLEFNEVRHEIENHIYHSRMEKALDKLVEELREKAYIHTLE